MLEEVEAFAKEVGAFRKEGRKFILRDVKIGVRKVGESIWGQKMGMKKE